MKNLPLLIALTALSLASAHAQNVEYGQPSDLKGIQRVFIDTGTDMKNRERIVKEINKSKIGVEILQSPEGAELVLTFGSESVVTGATVKTRPPLVAGFPARSRVETETSEQGEGFAYIPVSSGLRRIVFSWKGEQGFLAKVPTRFAAAFVKAFKKANSLK